MQVFYYQISSLEINFNNSIILDYPDMAKEAGNYPLTKREINESFNN
jgi:hypothetical protein